MRNIRDADYEKFGDVILFSNREFILGADVCNATQTIFVPVLGDGNCIFYVLALHWKQLEPGETKDKTYRELYLHLKNKVCFQSVTSVHLVTFLILYSWRHS
jgi:hypothetical protein